MLLRYRKPLLATTSISSLVSATRFPGPAPPRLWRSACQARNSQTDTFPLAFLNTTTTRPFLRHGRHPGPR
uniref:Putative secreted protein n=1 Tax=Anopheles triannulatus TaxID=58253 RepID=A0A2M4B7H9_9DIPT